MVDDQESHGEQGLGDVVVVLCTCPDGETARRLAAGLVAARLAACVNVLPEIRSIYRWQGETCDEAEVLMIAKTTPRAYPELEHWLRAQHPYEEPEVLALPVATGSSGYLEWVARETAST
jgi:periplasmic divalent cation tolerance protein